MANLPPQTNPPAPNPGLPALLAPHHKAVAYALFAAAVGFAIVPIVLAVLAATAPPKAADVKKPEPGKSALDRTPAEPVLTKPSWADALGPTFFWGVACSAVCLVVGLGCLSSATGRRLGEVERMRLMLMVLGASIGILTALQGIALPFTQGFRAVFLGGGEEWRKNIGRIFEVVGAVIGGLGLAFASLQLARGVERENALMRRLMYGFGAVFTTLLLVAVLLLVNVLPYIPSHFDPLSPFLNATFDWTQSRLYSLSDRSRATLTGLKEPVKVYIFLDPQDPVGGETQTLLENCRRVTDQISYEMVLSTHDNKRVSDLIKKYPNQQFVEKEQDMLGNEALVLRPGILVVYGEKGDSSPGPEPKLPVFLPEATLSTPEPDKGREVFHGEGALMKAIRSLAGRKLVIYFTQGDGEMPFENPTQEPNGLDRIKARMQNAENYELKGLTFGAGATEVPKDADIVVTAQPRRMKPEALKALGAYMGYDYHEQDGTFTETPNGRKGRLCLLAGANVVDNKMEHSGLEPLLAQLGVTLGDDRVLNLDVPNYPTVLPVQSVADSPNPVARLFAPPNATLFLFEDARPTRPAPGGPFQAVPILETASPKVWGDTHLEASPDDLARAREREDNPTFSAEPIPVGAAVSDKAAMPQDSIHAHFAAGAETPRLLVFGASNWISDAAIANPRTRAPDYNLFTNSLTWLGGEPDIGTSPEAAGEDKERPQVTVNFTSGGEEWATVLLPAAHMLLVVIAAGCGVWLVRRR